MTDISYRAAQEIIALHAAFIDLFTGRSRDYGRCDKAFAADFEMVSPEGKCLDRKAILAGIEGNRARGDFQIDIQDIRTIRETPTSALLQYVEQQYRDGRTTRCLSTALFEADDSAPLGVAWRYLHETWMRDAGQETGI